MEIRSALPLDRTIRLKVASVSESVKVSASDTLIDPYRAGSVNEMGPETIRESIDRAARPLHAGPGELRTRLALRRQCGSASARIGISDAICRGRHSAHRQPLAQLRPGACEADDVESLKIYTAGIPAEYGRKMGGVVEVNTLKSEDPGFHGQLTLFGGTYATGGIDTQDQYTWKGRIRLA